MLKDVSRRGLRDLVKLFLIFGAIIVIHWLMTR